MFWKLLQYFRLLFIVYFIWLSKTKRNCQQSIVIKGNYNHILFNNKCEWEKKREMPASLGFSLAFIYIPYFFPSHGLFIFLCFFSITFIKRGNNSFNIFSIDFSPFSPLAFQLGDNFHNNSNKNKTCWLSIICLFVCVYYYYYWTSRTLITPRGFIFSNVSRVSMGISTRKSG